MGKNKRKREIIPPWSMPSDPVKAIWWFMHWLLKVLIRFFWLPILVMVVYEILANLRVSGIVIALIEGVITLFVGGAVWGVLYALLIFVNISTGLQEVISDIGRLQKQGSLYHRPSSLFADPMQPDPEPEEVEHVVEGTITDLDEERHKRRRE